MPACWARRRRNASVELESVKRAMTPEAFEISVEIGERQFYRSVFGLPQRASPLARKRHDKQPDHDRDGGEKKNLLILTGSRIAGICSEVRQQKKSKWDLSQHPCDRLLD